MSATELCRLTLGEQSRLIESGGISPVELTQACLDRIDATDALMRAFITVMGDEALRDAKEAEQAIVRGGRLGPLHGVPMAVKDLIDVEGVRTTCGSQTQPDSVAGADATCVQRLRQSGAVIIGKTNLNEFALGATGQNPHYGDTKNPWDRRRISGGSSGGSGAAVASGTCAAALGTDTGGSVRIPAALCGVVGIKPTYGRISVHGVATLAWSLDHVGVLARGVEDAALVLNELCGPDPADPTCLDVPPPDFTADIDTGADGTVVGVPEEFVWDMLTDEVDEAVRGGIEALRLCGAEVRDTSLPLLTTAAEVSAPVLGAEAFSVYQDVIAQHGERIDPMVKGRFDLGAEVSTAAYIAGQRDRAALRAQVNRALQEVDVLAMPTCAAAAAEFGQTDVAIRGGSMTVLDTLTRLTRLSNLTGFPSISICCGFGKDGMPVGMQLVGRPLDEATLIRVAYAYEQATDWRIRAPDLSPFVD